jgi:hypothetical protein
MYSFSGNSQIKRIRTLADVNIFVFWYMELVPEICLHLSVTPCRYKNAHYRGLSFPVYKLTFPYATDSVTGK